jgi:uncharacterized membrane protein
MVSVLEKIGGSKMFQKIVGVFLMIMCVISSTYMAYLIGSMIVKDYLLNGIVPVIISFVIGTILMALFFRLFNKFVFKIKMNNKNN